MSVTVTQPATAAVDVDIMAELEAWRKRTDKDIAMENGYATWEEYQAARTQEIEEARRKWQDKAPERRAKEFQGLRKARQKQAEVERESSHQHYYKSENCFCSEHMRVDFCPGNLQSPTGSMVGFQAELDAAARPNLKDMVIKEGEPSKRLSGTDLYLMWFSDKDGDYQPQHLAPWFKRDELTQSLHERASKPTQQDGGFTAFSPRNPIIELFPASQPDSAVPFQQSKWTMREKTVVEKTQGRTLGLSGVNGPSELLVAVDKLHSASRLDSCTSATRNKKRSQDAAELEVEKDAENVKRYKRAEPSFTAASNLGTHITGGHHDDGLNDILNDRIISSPMELDESDNVAQLEIEAHQLARQAEKLLRRLELARARKRDRAQRSQGRRKVTIPDVQVVIEMPQSTLQVVSSTSQSPSYPDRVEKKRHRGAIKRGRKKTAPATRLGGVVSKVSSVQNIGAKNTKGASPWLPSFIEQPRRTRSQASQVFCELDGQGRYQLRRLRDPGSLARRRRNHVSDERRRCKEVTGVGMWSWETREEVQA
ncbi:MAG: hypothetical protein Q9208_005289 [Pyrenodesmia sp. 3 TL-2023]